MNNYPVSPYLLGFLAAALSVLTTHEILVWILGRIRLLPDAQPWSLKPLGPLKTPTILNSIFWGGLWGVVYVLLKDQIPISHISFRGLIFGLLIALFSNFTLLALLKGKPLFMGFDFKVIASVLVILGGFGISTALLFEVLLEIF